MNPKSSHNHIGVIEVGEQRSSFSSSDMLFSDIQVTFSATYTPMLKHQVDNPHCSASGAEMELTVYIPPFGSPSAQGL